MGRGDIRTKKGKIFRGTYGKSRPKKLKDPYAPKAWWHQSERDESFPVPIPYPPRPSPVHDPNDKPPAPLQALATLQRWMHDQGLHPWVWSQRHTVMAL
ncbi:hypothetical protein COCOBI_08-3770 [Coccomyxa sp. Obi]|nr:hypothetical protein COCOBI_08-3770 [Coccomyxa sp. Obi]